MYHCTLFVTCVYHVMYVNNMKVYDVYVFGEYVAGKVWRKGLKMKEGCKRCTVYQCYNAEHQALVKSSVCMSIAMY